MAATAAVAPVPASTIAWIKAHAVPIGAAESEPGTREARTIADIVGGAQLIGLGEPSHGHAEPLAYRNRLIRHLVAHGRLSAIALESGIADTRPASDYVLGGPGDARSAVAPMSWRFGTLADNVALVAWLRRWNDAHPRAKVRLYGIDVSGGDDQAGFGKARVVLDRIDAYLARAALPDSGPLRADIARIAPSFSPAGYAAANAADRAAILRMPDRIGAHLAGHKAAFLRATSPDAYDWATRFTVDAVNVARIFPVWPADSSKISPALLQATAMRESGMVQHTLWALSREKSRGRVLLFQSNSHVAATDLQPLNRPATGGMKPTGAQLRDKLGSRYRVILFASSLGKPADDPAIGTIDHALATASVSPAILDIRGAPPWWDARQTLAHGGVRINAMIPRRAFDGLIYVDRLTPARAVDGS
jgi:erythromycin esterase